MDKKGDSSTSSSSKDVTNSVQMKKDSKITKDKKKKTKTMKIEPRIDESLENQIIKLN